MTEAQAERKRREARQLLARVARAVELVEEITYELSMKHRRRLADYYTVMRTGWWRPQ